MSKEILSVGQKELIGLFLKVDVSEFSKYVVRSETLELNDKGIEYWEQLFERVLHLVEDEENLRWLDLESCGNAGGVERELKIAIYKGDITKAIDLVIIPHTSGEIKYLIVRRDKI